MQCYASGIMVYIVALCLPVRQKLEFYKMAKCIVMQTMPHNSLETLVYWCRRFKWNWRCQIHMGYFQWSGV